MVTSSYTEVGSKSKPSAFGALGNMQEADIDLVRGFWRSVERILPGANVRGRTDGREREVVVVSGWIAECCILPDGRRQIFSFLLPGDVVSVNGEAQATSRSLVALTHVEVADAAAFSASGPNAATAPAEARQAREERLFDQIVRIGRLTAMERVLNLMLELYDRLDAVGLVKEHTFRLPLTQEVLADALGLSVVHINRTLQELKRQGLLSIGRGAVTLQRSRTLASLACCNAEATRDEAQICTSGLQRRTLRRA